MTTRVRVFLNQKSGAGEATPERLRTLFGAHGVEAVVTTVRPGVDPGSFDGSDEPGTAWVAGGGDGTVRAVAEAVVRGAGRNFGVLALGTLNHFARDLGLPLALEQAVAAVAQDQTVAVDVAQVADKDGKALVFVNNSSLGAYPAMVIERERMKKAGRNKWASLLLASIKAFARFRCLTVTFEVEGKQRQCTTPFLFVGNNEYCVDGARLGERERLDRGELCLYLAPGATRATMLRFMAAAAVGRLKAMPEFMEFRTQEFNVQARGRKRLRVSLDGEVRRLAGPLRYRILPGALKVLRTG